MPSLPFKKSCAASTPSPTSPPTSGPTATFGPSKFPPGRKACTSAAAADITLRCNRNLMAGYSGTPLPRKLGIKEQFHILLPDIPADVKAELKEALTTCRVVKDDRQPLDFAMVFVKSAAGLKKKFSQVAKQLAPAGMLWV